ncbi:MAG: hypothetical protein ACOC1I_05145 [Spirochaetota bacterium]
MTSPLVAILAVALLFYVAIPGVGAFGVRQRWRRFRRRVTETSLFPPVTYASVRATRDDVATGTRARFLGALESIQGEHTLWIRGADLTIAVDMSQSDVYMVSQADSARVDNPPTRTSWKRVGSLPEGIGALVSGELDVSGVHPVIRSNGGEPVFVVFFDGDPPSLVRRCLWSGRQLNEYWNSVTPGALAGGAFALIVVAYVLMRQPISPGFARLAVALASVPLLPLLPPGVALFYLYRRTWRRGRILRAHRDVVYSPLRYFRGDEPCAELPNGGGYCRLQTREDEVRALVPDGLTMIETPVSDATPQWTLFGEPGREPLGPPSDPLSEWVAVKGNPLATSLRCQKQARCYELSSGFILGAALVLNFVLVAVLVRVLL